MTDIQVSEDISVEDFFENLVPKQFEETVSGTDLSFLRDREFTLQFTVGEKTYCVRVQAKEGMKVIPGGVEKPLLGISLSEPDWRESITGKLEGKTVAATIHFPSVRKLFPWKMDERHGEISLAPVAVTLGRQSEKS